MIIKNHMKRRVISIKGTATIKEAAQLVMEHNVGTLPVVDERELFNWRFNIGGPPVLSSCRIFLTLWKVLNLFTILEQ